MKTRIIPPSDLAAIQRAYDATRAMLERNPDEPVRVVVIEPRYLGNFAACEPWAAVGMTCFDCNVSWTGCWDNFECPICGKGELPSWDGRRVGEQDADGFAIERTKP